MQGVFLLLLLVKSQIFPMAHLITFVPPCSGKASVDVRLWPSSYLVDMHGESYY